MSVEQVGPGGVSNSYGVRTTTSKVVYENDNSYQDVFIPTGSVPVVATPSELGLEPRGIAPSGTVATNGTITLGTALDCTYSDGVRLYLPGGAFADGVGRFVTAVMSSTTVGLAYELSGALTVGSGSAYTGEASEVTVATITVPWSDIADSRCTEVAVSGVWSNSASGRSVKLKSGATTLITAATASTPVYNARTAIKHVGGGQVRFYNDGATGGSTTSANISLTKGADLVLPITLTKVAADFAILDLIRITQR